ncbi:MAG TPA: DinB family protein [Methylomirabilota bacterium]|jgi:hypothetical protein|nr:DinB family protein [Methylomirabilota bacterium]
MTPAQEKAQARARDYFSSKDTLTPVEIRDQIVASFASLEATLAEVPVARAGQRTAPAEWSAQEILDHLVETYRPGVDELRCVLAGQRPPGEPIPAALQSKAPLLRPWAWLREELRRAHDDVVALIDGVSPTFTTAARVPIVMVVNVTEPDGSGRPLHWVEDLGWKAYALTSWRLHAIDHMKQTRKVLAALA